MTRVVEFCRFHRHFQHHLLKQLVFISCSLHLRVLSLTRHLWYRIVLNLWSGLGLWDICLFLLITLIRLYRINLMHLIDHRDVWNVINILLRLHNHNMLSPHLRGGPLYPKLIGLNGLGTICVWEVQSCLQPVHVLFNEVYLLLCLLLLGFKLIKQFPD